MSKWPGVVAYEHQGAVSLFPLMVEAETKVQAEKEVQAIAVKLAKPGVVIYTKVGSDTPVTYELAVLCDP